MNNAVKKIPSAEKVFLVAVTVFAVFILFGSSKYSVEARTVPQMTAVLTLVLSVLVVVSIWKGEASKLENGTPEGLHRLRVTGMILPCYYIALYVLGYFIGTLVTIFIYARLLGVKKVISAATLAFMITILVFVIFQVFFYVPLPNGFIINGIL